MHLKSEFMPKADWILRNIIPQIIQFLMKWSVFLSRFKSVESHAHKLEYIVQLGHKSKIFLHEPPHYFSALFPGLFPVWCQKKPSGSLKMSIQCSTNLLMRLCDIGKVEESSLVGSSSELSELEKKENKEKAFLAGDTLPKVSGLSLLGYLNYNKILFPVFPTLYLFLVFKEALNISHHLWSL